MNNNKQSMKLYTEEQVREALWKTEHPFSDGKNVDEIMNSLIPIQLPSDEAIEKEALSKYPKNDYAIGIGKTYDEFAKQRLGFIEGSQMVINKIKGGNK